jgi:hypothetical protein
MSDKDIQLLMTEDFSKGKKSPGEEATIYVLGQGDYNLPFYLD